MPALTRRLSRLTGQSAPTTRSVAACILTIAAIALGGGGSSAPTSELALQLAAAIVLAAWILLPPRTPAPTMPPVLWGLIVLALIVPVVQLIPLPPSIWQAMPGRDVQKAALTLIGSEHSWRPWSIAPPRTVAALLAIVPPLVALAMVSMLDRSERYWVIAAIAGMALASFALGALQVSSGPRNIWYLYQYTHTGFLVGFHANRNAEVDVLLIGLVAWTAILLPVQRRLGRTRTGAILLAVSAVLVLGCLLTGSRTGIALVPVAFVFIVSMWWRRQRRHRHLAALAAATAVLVVGVSYLVQANRVLSAIFDRFRLDEDGRIFLWVDTWTAIKRFWPFDSGIGTFRPAFLPGEQLAVVDDTWPGRAHNEYLELLLEAGAAGAVVLAAAIALIVWVAIRAARRKSRPDGAQVLFACAALTIVAIHSIVDYPLRSMALAHLAAVAVGLLVAIAQQQGEPETAEKGDSLTSNA